jgi:hypothetical protein
MPEVQFFGLPAETINGGTNVATITYLKAEDATGNLYDILGKHQRLPSRSYSTSPSARTVFRFYIGTPQNIKTTDKTLYLDVHGGSGKVTGDAPIDQGWNNTLYRDISFSGDHRTSSYYELYIYSANNERITLCSGYTGGAS